MPNTIAEPIRADFFLLMSEINNDYESLSDIGSDFSKKAFGCSDFQWNVVQYTDASGSTEFQRTAHWVVHSNRPSRLKQHLRPDEMVLHHGTTASQCHAICSEGFFDIGRHCPGTISSPCGVWGTNEPGLSFERVHLNRGWSYGREEESSISGWDCPIVFAWIVKRSELKKHVELSTGTVYVHKVPCGTQWDVLDQHTEIWIHAGIWENFLHLKDRWQSLLLKESVVCRSRLGYPEDLYKCGRSGKDSSPMTCARVCKESFLTRNGWRKALKTGQWRCKFCSELGSRPCTDYA